MYKKKYLKYKTKYLKLKQMKGGMEYFNNMLDQDDAEQLEKKNAEQLEKKTIEILCSML